MKPNTSSKAAQWAGLAITVIASVILVLSAAGKIRQPPGAEATFAKIGYEASQMLGIAALELCCTALYLIPRTSTLGAVLLTGYLGGAIAAHVRIHDAFFVPLALGVMIWAGLWLRDPKLRTWLPFRA